MRTVGAPVVESHTWSSNDRRQTFYTHGVLNSKQLEAKKQQASSKEASSDSTASSVLPLHDYINL